MRYGPRETSSRIVKFRLLTKVSYSSNMKTDFTTTLTAKAPLSRLNNPQSIEVGDLLYLYSDRNKSCSRDSYLVVLVENNWCNVRKFVGLQLRNFSYRVKTCEHRLSQRPVNPSYGLVFLKVDGQTFVDSKHLTSSELDDSKTKLRPNSSISSLVQAEQ